MSSFFAMMSRMKYIDRWALMRNSSDENIAEHSQEVAMLAHALCVIGNVRLGKNLDARKAAMVGLYHDATEILTGDLPTPIKYKNETIREAYKDIENEAAEGLLKLLPEDLRDAFRPVFFPAPEDLYMARLVKAADRLSAMIKCLEEKKAGNREFANAEQATQKALEDMARELPELDIFLKEFLPAYSKTLDEL